VDHNRIAPTPAVRRLPAYLQLLRKAMLAEESYISSARIARELDLEPIQVRKDLSLTGLAGQPRLGFDVKAMINAIELFLGWDNTNDAFLIGAGNLGSALVGYNGFMDFGLNISALFDNDDDKVGSEIHGRKVYSLDQLIDLAWRMHVNMGVLAVSAGAAQQVADLMVDAGIVAIWNFTPAKLKLPASVIVERVDLAASLAVLSSRLSRELTKRRGAENGN